MLVAGAHRQAIAAPANRVLHPTRSRRLRQALLGAEGEVAQGKIAQARANRTEQAAARRLREQIIAEERTVDPLPRDRVEHGAGEEEIPPVAREAIVITEERERYWRSRAEAVARNREWPQQARFGNPQHSAGIAEIPAIHRGVETVSPRHEIIEHGNPRRRREDKARRGARERDEVQNRFTGQREREVVASGYQIPTDQCVGPQQRVEPGPVVREAQALRVCSHRKQLLNGRRLRIDDCDAIFELARCFRDRRI